MKRASCKFLPRLRIALTPAGAACLCLSAWGCLAIYNATFHLDPAFHFVGRQAVWAVLGTLALLFTSAHGPADYRRGTVVFAGIAYALLWLVLLFGIRVNGMRGWFAWHGIFLQPSELGKPAFVLAVALLFERTRRFGDNWLRGYAPVLALAMLWIVPIAMQPDFGTAFIYIITFAALYWTAGGKVRHLLVSGLALLPVAVLVVHRTPYVQRRLTAFLRPEAHAWTSGWHVLQFQRTLASGGLTGTSWGRGLWSQAYLPLGYSDSIFAGTAEAIGFLGVLPVILLILVWVAYGTNRAYRTEDDFTRTAVLGLVAMLGSQAFVHLSVTLGLLPATGVTLPFISYGGSSLLSSFTAVGIVEGLTHGRGELLPETR